ncbi:hypothetical protein SH528x_003934 [Novipirellula sp. SH528]|uniref:hypothetical protein n=1 Tax=Novipirellula sp. SH528 TaxID=3454466 RepID=UPI003FA13754
MTWFEKLTEIDEMSPEQVRRELSVEGDFLVCPSGKRIACGRLKTPKLSELRERVRASDVARGRATIAEIVGDVRQLHTDSANANALFQVASQFNLLEMAGPTVTPEQGVGIYEHDHTQGPACAIACGAGTIFRNYFVPVQDSIGQTANPQIDCSADLGQRLGNAQGRLWSMQNGYLFPTDGGLEAIVTRLQKSTENELDELRGELRIGVQSDAAVTLPGSQHLVSQAYCSALPIAYGRQPQEQWADFAQLILDAAYEATLCAAILNTVRTGFNRLYLTLLGGGVFGNRDEWIVKAIERAVLKYRDFDLDIQVVSYNCSKPIVADLVSRLR